MKALRIFKVVFCPMAAAVLQFFVLPSKVFASVMALLLLLIAALNLWEAGLLCGRTEPKEPAMQSKGPSRDTAERARELAKQFHEAYERLAPSFSYQTRKESAVPWEQVPENNRKLMEAVCAEVCTQIQAEARERLAAWMVEHRFSTGHGDTFEDLLKELDWQVKELRGQQRALLTEQDVTEAYQSAPNWHSVLSSLNYRAIKNAALAQALQPGEKEGKR